MKFKRKLAFCLAVLSAGVMTLSGCSSNAGLLQYDREIGQDEQVAVITVKNFGVIKARFFEKEAPKAVENFLTHAKNGYYDGLTFHCVMNDFMIQGGDPKGDGTGGESIWGEDFGVKSNDNLRHFRGALSMANTGEPNSNSSQFFIVQNPTVEEDEFSYYEQTYGKKFSKEMKEKYTKDGGAPWLDGDYTVFGQVFAGMDIVDQIAEVNTDANNMPMEDVIIEKIEVMTYAEAIK